MADEKVIQKSKPDADKEAAKATLLALAGTKPPEAPKAQKAKPEEVKVKTEPVKAEVTKEVAKPEGAKEAAPEGKTGATKAEVKKEADPNKESVDGIMAEMALKGASKKRLIKMLGEQFNFDKHKVMFRLKRALISERYAAAHAEAGH